MVAVERVPYEEFSYLRDNAADFGIPFDHTPATDRVGSLLDDGRVISAIQWHVATPEIVLLHGGAQNAHTFDTTMLALNLPALCIDLPGHGHSALPRSANHDVVGNAEDVAQAIADLAPSATTLVGMSLGGLTALSVMALNPGNFERLMLIDMTPEPDRAASQAIINFVDGPASFPSFDDILARTIEHNPTRSESSLRRGILHNAVQRDDGSWVWRHRRGDHPGEFTIDFEALWVLAETITKPVLLCRGMKPGSVVTDESEHEFLERMPNASVRRFANGGHSLQGDSPLELADVLRAFHANG